MLSKYPNQLDDDVVIPSVNDNITEVSGETINALREAVFAIQSALGTDPQGSAADLKTRLSYFFEDDGTPKASALLASGLIALPVTDPMIAANAAILESKLDLDVPTQDLQNQISSNDVDIATLQILYNQLLFDFTQHFLGNDFRHDGYDIAFGTALPDAPALDTVSLAIHYVWAQFLAHRQALSGIEHYASAISYTPTPNGPITATDVQGAISQMDTAFFEDRRRHDDSAHSNGISADGYFINFGQFAVNDASARVARIPSSPNILKLGLINGASIKSKGFDPNGISVSSNAFAVEVSAGEGIFRSLNITGLHAVQYPLGLSRVSLKAVVDYLNQQFQLPANHFPVTAFESEDGELVLQHNIAHPSCTIAVRNANPSAVDQLGFTDVLNTISGYVNNYSLHVDGYRYYELATLSSGNLTQAVTSSSVDLGTITGPGGLGIEANMLFHVFNHNNAAANGTYRIVGTIINSVTLNTTLTSGTFSYIIYKDTIDSNFTGNFKTLDLYIDSNRNTSSSVRQETTLVQISGLKIVEVSQDFPATSGSMTLNFSSPTYSLSITNDGYTGQDTTFEIGFRGYKKVYSSDNKSYVTVFIFDPAPTVGTDQITFYASEKQDDKLLLGTTHTNAASVIEFPLNRRNVGLTGKTALSSEVITDIFEADIRNLHSNGVIRGFDILQINPGGTAVALNGGLAYVGGRRIERTRASIDITKVATSDGLWNLVLSKNGNIEIYSDNTPGFAVEDIISGSEYLILAQITVAGGIVTSFIDGRFFINEIESKIDLVVDDQELGAGQFRTLESAILNSRFSPNNNKPEIKIISDLTINEDVLVDISTEITAFKDLTINGDLTLLDGATFQVFGELTVTGAIVIGSNCTLIIGGGSVNTITVNSNSIINITNDLTLTSISILGNDVAIMGSVSKPALTFAGTTTGIDFNTAVSNTYIGSMELIMTYSIFPIIGFSNTGPFSSITIENNLFRQSIGFSDTSPTTLRQGVYVGVNADISYLRIINNTFNSLSHGIEINSSAFTLSDLLISNNVFTGLHKGILIQTVSGTADSIIISNNTFIKVFNACTTISSTTIDSISGVSFQYNIVDNDLNSYISGATALLNTDAGCASVMCNSNIALRTLSTMFSIGGNSSVISNNLIDNCTGGIGAFSSSTVISNNLLTNMGTSQMLSIDDDTNAIISGNIFVSSHAFTKYSFGHVGTGTGIIICMGNRFIDGGTSNAIFNIPNGAMFIENYVQSGRITMASNTSTTSGTFRSIVSNNRFVGNGFNGVNNFEVLPGITSPETAIFSNNMIECSGSLTVASVKVSAASGRVMFSGNSITAGTGGGALLLDIASTGTPMMLISGNQFINNTGGGIARAVRISSSNIFYTGNITEGSFTVAEIDVIGSPSNVYVSNNVLNGTNTGGKKINISSTATSTVARNNKNALESWTYSALNALQYTSSDWTFTSGLPSTFNIKSASATSCLLIVPLNVLPVGAVLESVEAVVTTPGTAGTLNMRVYRRGTGSHTLSTVSSSIDNSPSIFQTMSTGTMTHNILDDNEYFLVFTSTAANNIIGQIIANIRI